MKYEKSRSIFSEISGNAAGDISLFIVIKNISAKSALCFKELGELKYYYFQILGFPKTSPV